MQATPEAEHLPAEREVTLHQPRVRLLVRALGALIVLVLLARGIERTWSLTDDAFISFRYAKHLVEGWGLVWNEGERVEGYTNFLWVLLMAAGMKLEIAPEVLSNVLGIASGVALLVALHGFSARLRPGSIVPWLLVVTLALSGSFAAWCTSGLETMLFTLLVFLGFASLLDAPSRRRVLGSSLAFALATLTRPEGALFAALAGLFFLADVLVRKRTLGAGATWLAPCVLLVGAHVLWRRSYYGEWLPNTFYAKVPGLWLEQGRRYFAYFADSYRIAWFLPLALLALAGKNRAVALRFLVVLAAYGAYVLAIGGDLFEFRFLVPVFPYLYWLIFEGLATLAGAASRTSALNSALRLASAALLVALLWTTAVGYERVPGTSYDVISVPGIRNYTNRRIDEGNTLRTFIEQGVLPRDLVLCVGGAGAVPYYTGWTTVDRRGLNDAYIARLPVEERSFIAHERDAPFDYLVERGVAVFDLFNRLVVTREELMSAKARYDHDGREVALRAVRLGERFLVFATFVSDPELERLFPGLEIVSHAAPPRDG